MWYIQDNQTFPVFTTYFHHSKEVFVCSLIVNLRCVFWVGLFIRGGGIDSPRPASQRAAAFILTAIMLTSLTAPAFAGTWYIEDGDITVKASGTEGKNKVSQGTTIDEEDTNTIITNREGKASSHTVTIEAKDKDDKVEVTLDNVNIKTDSGTALTSKGDVTLTLKGDNSLTGGNGGSGISSSGSLTITGGEKDSLTAQGGSGRSGIFSSGGVTISGGTVNATGGSSGSDSGDGIHSGSLTMKGGTVNAKGGSGADGGSGIRTFSSGGVTISGGSTVNATGGDASDKDASAGGSGILIFGSGSLTVSDSTVTATGGNGGSARGSHGGNGISGKGSLTVSGGTVTATGGNGSKSESSDRSNGGRGIDSGSLTVSGGTVTATGGDGCSGSYSDGGIGISSSSGGVTIYGGTVTATGGKSGSGDYSNGGNGISSSGSLSISGGTVTATAGSSSGSYGRDGITTSSSLTISGGTVTANGGSGSYRGGSGISSSDIELSGSLELTAKAGSPNGKALSQNGSELDPNTFKEKLDPGAKVTTTDADGKVIKQVSIPRPVEPEKPVIPEESSSSSDGGSATPSAPASPLPGLTVTDKSGAVISYTSTQSGNTLTVCVGRFTASFRISLAALRQLRAEGIETINFQTILCSTTLSVDELLAMGGEDAEIVLIHHIRSSTLTVGGKAM